MDNIIDFKSVKINTLNFNMIKLIIINQSIKEWQLKGEIHKGYFNPKKNYKLIIILSFKSNDQPSYKALKILCEKSKFKFINIKNFFLTNNYIRYLLPKFLLKVIIKRELKILNLKKPQLVRCIGDGFIGYISTIIAGFYSCKSTISIHRYISLKIFFKYLSIKEKIFFLLDLRFKNECHRRTNKILAVYSKISENIAPNNKHKLKISLNNFNPVDIRKINKAHKNKITKLVFVGRLIKGKSITNIIHAIKDIDNVSLTVFGDGPEMVKIITIINTLKLQKKIILRGFVSNTILREELVQYDAFTAKHEFYEFPKTIIEALLTGLPIILNSKPSKTLQEFKNLKILWTDGSIDSYKKIITNFKNEYYDIESQKRSNLRCINKLLRESNKFDD